jgi:hypothetical protein
MELKSIASVERRLIEAGVGEAWKLSELAHRWGHKTEVCLHLLMWASF